MGMLDSLNFLRKAAMGDYSHHTSLNLPTDIQCVPGLPDVLPDVVPPVLENFSAISLQDLKNNATSFKHGDLNTFTQAWKNAGADLNTSNEDFQKEIDKIVGDKWRGPAADKAKEGVGQYTTEAHNFVTALDQVSTKMNIAASGFQQTHDQMNNVEVKHNLFDSVGESLSSHIFGGSGPAIFSKYIGADHRAQQQAVAIMNNVYTPTATTADSRVPALPVAVNPFNSGDGPGPKIPWTPTVVPVQPTDHPIQPAIVPHNQPTDQPVQPHVDPNQPTDQNNPVGPDPSTQPASVDPSATPTAPAAATPDPFSGKGSPTGLGGLGDLTTGSAGAAANGAGIGGGLVAGGGLSGGAGGGALKSPTLGGASAGSAGVGTPGGVAAGGRGPAGAAGGGMMPHGAKSKGEDDKEHKSADYLVNIDNGNELIGKMPKVAPPVLGG